MDLTRAEFHDIVKNTPLVSIDLIVRTKSGKVLLGKRTNEPAKGSLFVPGGRIRKDETIANAFRRLTHVELGREYNVSDARFLGVFEHFYKTNALNVSGFGTHYVVLGYELLIDAEITDLPKVQHSEYYWLTESDVRNEPFVHENSRAYFGLKQIRGGK